MFSTIIFAYIPFSLTKKIIFNIIIILIINVKYIFKCHLS